MLLPPANSRKVARHVFGARESGFKKRGLNVFKSWQDGFINTWAANQDFLRIGS